jgi:hypothetical protein
MGPILLEIAEAKMFEAAANANVTDIIVPSSPGAGSNFSTINKEIRELNQRSAMHQL